MGGDDRKAAIVEMALEDDAQGGLGVRVERVQRFIEQPERTRAQPQARQRKPLSLPRREILARQIGEPRQPDLVSRQNGNGLGMDKSYSCA